MGRVRNTPDSYSPLLVEMQFVKASPAIIVLTSPVPGTAGQDVRVDPQRYLRSMRVEEHVESAWSGNIVLFDTDEDFIEGLLTPLDEKDRIVKFRWGWDQGNGLSNVSWLTGRIVKWESTYTFEGVELNLSILSAVPMGASMDKRTRSFEEGLSPSDIVRQIAADREWKTTDSDGNPTIEEADYTFDKPLQQHNESDVNFIKQYVMPYATDSSGQAFWFWVEQDDVVHFHTKQYIPKRKVRPQVAASYTYARDVRGDVVAFTPQNTHVFSYIAGGQDAIYIFTDERTGQRIQIETTAEGGPDNAIVSFPDEKTRTFEGNGQKARRVIPARSIREGRQMVRALYDKKRLAAYPATLEVRGTHQVRANDYISVRYFKKDGAEHYLSGVYWVKGVQHDISPGEWKCTFDLARAGARAQETTQENDTISSEKQQSIEELQERGIVDIGFLLGNKSESRESKTVR